jgi:hypothetical protein
MGRMGPMGSMSPMGPIRPMSESRMTARGIMQNAQGAVSALRVGFLAGGLGYLGASMRYCVRR